MRPALALPLCLALPLACAEGGAPQGAAGDAGRLRPQGAGPLPADLPPAAAVNSSARWWSRAPTAGQIAAGVAVSSAGFALAYMTPVGLPIAMGMAHLGILGHVAAPVSAYVLAEKTLQAAAIVAAASFPVGYYSVDGGPGPRPPGCGKRQQQQQQQQPRLEEPPPAAAPRVPYSPAAPAAPPKGPAAPAAAPEAAVAAAAAGAEPRAEPSPAQPQEAPEQRADSWAAALLALLLLLALLPAVAAFVRRRRRSARAAPPPRPGPPLFTPLQPPAAPPLADAGTDPDRASFADASTHAGAPLLAEAGGDAARTPVADAGTQISPETPVRPPTPPTGTPDRPPTPPTVPLSRSPPPRAASPQRSPPRLRTPTPPPRAPRVRTLSHQHQPPPRSAVRTASGPRAAAPPPPKFDFFGLSLADGARFQKQSVHYGKLKVRAVEGPALEAGIQEEDVIRTAGEATVRSRAAWRQVLRSHPVGQPLQLGIERDGAMLSFSVTPRVQDTPSQRHWYKPVLASVKRVSRQVVPGSVAPQLGDLRRRSSSQPSQGTPPPSRGASMRDPRRTSVSTVISLISSPRAASRRSLEEEFTELKRSQVGTPPPRMTPRAGRASPAAEPARLQAPSLTPRGAAASPPLSARRTPSGVRC